MKKEWLLKGLAVVSLPILIGLAPTAAYAADTSSSAAPTTLYVSTSGNDSTATGTSTSPYQTIDAAVKAASAGDTIVLEPGTYKESVTIDKQLVLKSDSSQKDAAANTIIDATGLDNAIVISGSGADYTVVVGLTVENANNHGIWVNQADDVVILGNTLTGNGANPDKTIAENKPLLLDGSSHSIVAKNTVTGNLADGGISVTDDGKLDPGASAAGPAKPVAAVDNEILNNTVSANKGGCGVVVASYNPGGGVIGNLVQGNSVTKGVAGIVVAADPPGTIAENNVVRKNFIQANMLPGIIVHLNAPNQTVSGNVLDSNTLDGNGTIGDPEAGLHQTAGIAVIGAVGPVDSTSITNNTFTNEYYGVWESNTTGTSVAPSNTADSTVTDLVYTAK